MCSALKLVRCAFLPRVEIDTEAYWQNYPAKRVPGPDLDFKKDVEEIVWRQKQRHNLELTLWLLDHNYPIQDPPPDEVP